jgi:hypothetical protein
MRKNMMAVIKNHGNRIKNIILERIMSRVEELNERIYQRFQGDKPSFSFSPRPVPTKYTTLPILDQRTSGKEIKQVPIFDVNRHFLPGDSAPWSGKADNIDIETDLYLGKDYFPSTQSDLYKVNVPSQFVPQPFPLLQASVVSSDNGIKATIPEQQLFYNVTRIKNIS